MNKKIVVVGTGQVGKALVNGFAQRDYDVTLSGRNGHFVDGWSEKIGKSSVVVGTADIVALAVKGTAAENVVRSLANLLKGKTVIDVTNPIADAPPQNGVIKFFTNLDESLMERLQKLAPGAHFVKAFNSVGNGLFFMPDYNGVKATMFICGNDEGAKKEVTEILNQIGWEVEDLGKAESARAIESLCMLWCIPGLLHNRWSHAFKLLKR